MPKPKTTLTLLFSRLQNLIKILNMILDGVNSFEDNFWAGVLQKRSEDASSFYWIRHCAKPFLWSTSAGEISRLIPLTTQYSLDKFHLFSPARSIRIFINLTLEGYSSIFDRFSYLMSAWSSSDFRSIWFWCDLAIYSSDKGQCRYNLWRLFHFLRDI